MENATKALLIAGSVLIVIILIAVGISILSSTSGVANEVGSTSEAVEISVANSPYTDFTGVRTGAEVKEVLTKAAATHRNGTARKVSVKVISGAGLTAGTYDTANEIATVMSGLRVNSTYTVGVEYDAEGYVNAVTIK